MHGTYVVMRTTVDTQLCSSTMHGLMFDYHLHVTCACCKCAYGSRAHHADATAYECQEVVALVQKQGGIFD